MFGGKEEGGGGRERFSFSVSGARLLKGRDVAGIFEKRGIKY